MYQCYWINVYVSELQLKGSSTNFPHWSLQVLGDTTAYVEKIVWSLLWLRIHYYTNTYWRHVLACIRDVWLSCIVGNVGTTFRKAVPWFNIALLKILLTTLWTVLKQMIKMDTAEAETLSHSSHSSSFFIPQPTLPTMHFYIGSHIYCKPANTL